MCVCVYESGLYDTCPPIFVKQTDKGDEVAVADVVAKNDCFKILKIQSESEVRSAIN